MNKIITLFLFFLCSNTFNSFASICNEPACMIADSQLKELDPLKDLPAPQISSMLLVDDILPDQQILLELQSELELNQQSYDKISALSFPSTEAVSSQFLMEKFYHQGLINFNWSKLKLPDSIHVTAKPKK
ncbi:MAG: hypothetical protein H6625_09035 [Bdellovibrionaceae bacterium]|nr:hypothetical protein [Pseudobdellovibrionaceae bacterium]